VWLDSFSAEHSRSQILWRGTDLRVKKLATFSRMSLTLACAGAAKADNFSANQFVSWSENDWGSGTASPQSD